MKRLDRISVVVPDTNLDHKVIERLMKLAEKRDRSVNCLVVEAILQYLKREENKG